MSTPNDGGAAFPVVLGLSDPAGGWRQIDSTEGLSLRDYFAAAALQGLLADPGYAPARRTNELPVPAIARHAFEYADAMLAEREKRGA